MATAVRMSNTTSDSLTTELSRTVVPCALKNNSWLVYNSVYCMRRVRHCHKVCSLFGTVSALQRYWRSIRTSKAVGINTIDTIDRSCHINFVIGYIT